MSALQVFQSLFRYRAILQGTFFVESFFSLVNRCFATQSRCSKADELGITVDLCRLVKSSTLKNPSAICPNTRSLRASCFASSRLSATASMTAVCARPTHLSPQVQTIERSVGRAQSRSRVTGQTCYRTCIRLVLATASVHFQACFSFRSGCVLPLYRCRIAPPRSTSLSGTFPLDCRLSPLSTTQCDAKFAKLHAVYSTVLNVAAEPIELVADDVTDAALAS